MSICSIYFGSYYLWTMKRVGQNKTKPSASRTMLATCIPTFQVNYHTGELPKILHAHAKTRKGGTPSHSETHYVTDTGSDSPQKKREPVINEPSLDSWEQLPDSTATTDEDAGLPPAYEDTKPCDENGAKVRQTVTHMEEMKSQEAVFLETLLSLYYLPQLLAPCACGKASRLRTVACSDCLQAELVCRQCWLDKHRTTPTHWALIWNSEERFFEKHDFCRVLKNTAVAIGHNGRRCPEADPIRTFTLVDSNGIHATSITFCRCRTPDGQRGEPDFKQLLRAGIFPGSVKEPKTGYTLGLLKFYQQLRSQGKGSAYNFVLVLQRLADPFFAGSVPDVYANFLAITRYYHHLDIIMRRGYAHGIDTVLPDETNRPYPNRPIGYLGLQCAACPERGVNMPLVVTIPEYLRHLISQNFTLDGNFKANLFFKRDNGSDKALTDGRMYFPSQLEYDAIAEKYVVKEEDKEVPCNAHIGSIRHQGLVKYGNTAVSGVVACACDHAVVGSFIDMKKGEAFALGTYAQREHVKHTNSPPHGPSSTSPTVWSYDSWCSFEVHHVERAIELFPEEKWLHTLLAESEGQIPADHINGHGLQCQTVWQAVYFPCRGHFHGETAEMVWAFLNPLGASTRQMTAGARHDTLNFVIDAWNWLKVLRQAELAAAERLDALGLFELHMAVVRDLSNQNATEVVDWSRMDRNPKKSVKGPPESVYQHKSRSVMTIQTMLASMIAEERQESPREEGYEARTSAAQWIRDGVFIERDQQFLIALLECHRKHPLEETWETIVKQRNALNGELKYFRERQREIYPRLRLSALDADEPELTAIQLPSYRVKHGQRLATEVGAAEADTKLREAEIKLRCRQVENGILAVQDACLALSAVSKARDSDYRAQAGKTPLVTLGYMADDAVEPYPVLTLRDTRRKETHLHRAKGDSRLFDGTAWYLQSGVRLSDEVVASPLENERRDSEDDEPRLLAGYSRSQRAPKRLKDIAPDDVVVEGALSSEAKESDVEMSPSKQGKLRRKSGKRKAKKDDGWIWKWLERGTRAGSGDDGKLEEYKRETADKVPGMRVQWFRAEAEMYRWLEQYERKHAELTRIIGRYHHDRQVWVRLADRAEQQAGQVNGAATFARMQAAMYRRLEHNAKAIYKSADSGAHHDWVAAKTFDDLVMKIDKWRDVVLKWMDEMV
ncbi:hypothetical protein GGX14DRAFT_405891 [Mycena pura]|uniref:CxC2-like cysteine cluster KDZ transposase-associated domain-containing protein n=1 Tax=Mycena pura TaxID=153505 RepID=A0AAD6URC5_9AGAR|nr:hypothetical protein GGX14DRAFT_405891 [Mycena pura]